MIFLDEYYPWYKIIAAIFIFAGVYLATKTTKQWLNIFLPVRMKNMKRLLYCLGNMRNG